MKLITRLVSGVALSVVSVSAFAGSQSSFQQFMPENDLWKQDSLEKAPVVTEELFNKVIDAALEVYNPIAKQAGDWSGILINRRWDDPTVNANCRRGLLRRVTINMYGGLARRDEISGDAFALVLCHEIGHAYGGTPYVQDFLHLSAEGQADYYGANACLQNVLEKIPAPESDMLAQDNGTLSAKCRGVAAVGTPGYTMCVRRLSAGFQLGKLLSALKSDGVPEYNTPDSTVVSETLKSYPDTTQCRVDTYLAGTFGLPRPACWFAN